MTYFEKNFITFAILFIVTLILLSIPLLVKSETITQIIAEKAHQYGVDPQLALYISYKESNWNPNAKGDYKNGKPTSFGIWQIHNPSQKGLTITQSYDLIISTNWAMKTMAKEGCKQWSTCQTSSSL